jgi:hypothetical protein
LLASKQLRLSRQSILLDTVQRPANVPFGRKRASELLMGEHLGFNRCAGRRGPPGLGDHVRPRLLLHDRELWSLAADSGQHAATAAAAATATAADPARAVSEWMAHTRERLLEKSLPTERQRQR